MFPGDELIADSGKKSGTFALVSSKRSSYVAEGLPEALRGKTFLRSIVVTLSARLSQSYGDIASARVKRQQRALAESNSFVLALKKLPDQTELFQQVCFLGVDVRQPLSRSEPGKGRRLTVRKKTCFPAAPPVFQSLEPPTSSSTLAIPSGKRGRRLDSPSLQWSHHSSWSAEAKCSCILDIISSSSPIDSWTGPYALRRGNKRSLSLLKMHASHHPHAPHDAGSLAQAMQSISPEYAYDTESACEDVGLVCVTMNEE
jgi:hypothetical protein